ncbi:DAHP synthase I alpha 1 [Pectobacterium sp. F1-1]|nr:DAHP synthase I alpha 1 [Pectobacterium sp. F1-1]
MLQTDELRSARIESLVTPQTLLTRLPITPAVAENVTSSRKKIEAILTGQDPRLLVVIGPCSIHDTDSALDYARRLAALRTQYQDRLEIVMRTYFGKNRARS